MSPLFRVAALKILPQGAHDSPSVAQILEHSVVPDGTLVAPITCVHLIMGGALSTSEWWHEFGVKTEVVKSASSTPHNPYEEVVR
jgi:hypothetical protein